MISKTRLSKLENKLRPQNKGIILVFDCFTCGKPHGWLNTNYTQEEGDAIVGKNGWCECPDTPYRYKPLRADGKI